MCGIDVELVTHNDAAAQVSRASVMTAQHSLLRRRGPDSVSEHTIHGMGYALRMAGSVLSMRGHEVVSQPIIDPGGNALLWNGEIFGGSVPVPPGASDSQCLSAALARAFDPRGHEQRARPMGVCILARCQQDTLVWSRSARPSQLTQDRGRSWPVAPSELGGAATPILFLSASRGDA